MRSIPLYLAVAPVVLLLGIFVIVLVVSGADSISPWSSPALLISSASALVIARLHGSLTRRGLRVGFARSASQLLPAIVMLVFISTVATTWMLSGVVPTLMDYGIRVLNPRMFLIVACGVCSLVAVLTGSSWSTIATIGLAFMGIGTVLGFSPAWIAGAVISGAYFGDKVSPLSDTTVLASSACGVNIFKHIRYMMLTSVPAMLVAMAVYGLVGLTVHTPTEVESMDILSHLEQTFNISAWTLLIPVITVLLIVMRVNTTLTLALSSLMGCVGIFVFQPGLAAELVGQADGSTMKAIGHFLWTSTDFNTGYGLLDSLVGTSGIMGMLSTIFLVLSAMVFGMVMIGTGMLASITKAITSRLQRRFPIIATTVGSGLFLNSCTADQYLSLIIGGNMFRDAYRRTGMEPRLLSRTLEDSVSVTSVLIPWNSCGVTHSAVLGVATVVYFPFCIFNYMSPVMTLIMAYTGLGIRKPIRRLSATSVQA
ncbi:MAG: sodium:proton antiporter [Muribaculaceae bacterium]|nr:sodium:proton antiporter [Muribaculaceae bacterium]